MKFGYFGYSGDLSRDDFFFEDVVFSTGRTYPANNLLSRYGLNFLLRIENKSDVSTQGGDYISGWRNPVKVSYGSTDLFKINKIVLRGTEKITIIDSPSDPSSEGSVTEQQVSSEVQIRNDPGEVIVRGKEDYEKYFHVSEYVPGRIRVEYELTEIWFYGTELYYKLSFDLNGGVGSLNMPLPPNIRPRREFNESDSYGYAKPTRSGYMFLGWSEDSAANKPQLPVNVTSRSPSSTHASFPGSKTFIMPARDVRLYAIWWKYTYRPLTKNGVIIRSPSNNLILRDGDG